MPIRMTGMVSGLDTDSIVKELVSAYSTKRKNTKKSGQNLAGSRRSGKI